MQLNFRVLYRFLLHFKGLLDVFLNIFRELPESLEIHVDFVVELKALIFDLLRHTLMILI